MKMAIDWFNYLFQKCITEYSVHFLSKFMYSIYYLSPPQAGKNISPLPSPQRLHILEWKGEESLKVREFKEVYFKITTRKGPGAFVWQANLHFFAWWKPSTIFHSREGGTKHESAHKVPFPLCKSIEMVHKAHSKHSILQNRTLP